MKVLIQRVTHASVVVAGNTLGAIDRGLLLFIGIEQKDDDKILERMADKVLAYRVFPDELGKMNLSVRDISGGVLAISQFTLAASTRKGLRPSFSVAATPQAAERTYGDFLSMLRSRHGEVAAGEFGADMKVSLLNDGPVTFLLEM